MKIIVLIALTSIAISGCFHHSKNKSHIKSQEMSIIDHHNEAKKRNEDIEKGKDSPSMDKESRKNNDEVDFVPENSSTWRFWQD